MSYQHSEGGAQVATVGSQPCRAASSLSPDRLTDIKMPRMDGVELGRRIVEGNRRVPVLYMSGDPGAADHPPAPLLRKPFSMSLLVGVVDRLLLGSPAGSVTD